MIRIQARGVDAVVQKRKHQKQTAVAAAKQSALWISGSKKSCVVVFTMNHQGGWVAHYLALAWVRGYDAF